jgi:hypothetical protein
MPERTDPPASAERRSFSPDEAQAIFRRAARRQHAVETQAPRDGLSLEELQRIGAEAGLDPAFVAAAATEERHRAEKTAERTWLYGAPKRIYAERVLPYDVDDAAWTAMVTELRRAFDTDGVAGAVGSMREWSTASAHGRPVRFSLTPEVSGSRLVLTQARHEPARAAPVLTGVFGLVALVLFVGALLDSGSGAVPLVAAAAFATTALATGGLARWWHGASYRRQETRFDETLDRLELAALRHVRDRTADEAGASPAGAASDRDAAMRAAPPLDALQDDDASARTGAPRRRARS